MINTAKTLMGVFATTDFLIPLVLGDLTDEEARKRSRGDEGPSITWAIGHLLHFRYITLGMLGAERENPYAPRFGDVAATDGADYPTLEALIRDWTSVSEALQRALEATTEEALDASASFGDHDEQTLREKLAFLAFHEGYHLGAVGAMRKSIGHLGPAEKVMAMQEADQR